MISALVAIVVLATTAVAIKPTAYKPTRHEYRELPSLFEFEDFDDCFESLEGIPRYCLLDVEVQKSPESSLWNKIQHKNTGTFRYDKLFMGVCWNRCVNYTAKFDTLMVKNYRTGRLEDKRVIVRNMEVYKRAFDRHAIAHNTINMCLNHEFVKRYGLRINSTVEYCVDEWSEGIENGEF